MEQFGPNMGQVTVKHDPSDKYSTVFNDRKMRDVLLNNRMLYEFNNCLVIMDDVTGNYTFANADYAYAYIRKGHLRRDGSDCVWTLRRVKKTIFGNYKPSSKRLANTFICGPDRAPQITALITRTNWNFYQLYTYMRSLPGSTLPEYVLPDKGQVPAQGNEIPGNYNNNQNWLN